MLLLEKTYVRKDGSRNWWAKPYSLADGLAEVPDCLCNTGLQKLIHVPQSAKKLYISIHDRAPSGARSNLLVVIPDINPDQTLWDVDGDMTYISYTVRPFLCRVASHYWVTTLFISFEYGV